MAARWLVCTAAQQNHFHSHLDRKHTTTLQTADPSGNEKAAAQKALRPIIIDGIAASYIANPRFSTTLLQESAGERPQRPNQFLRGSMYGLVNCYHAVGIDEYDWRSFGPDLDQVQWEYFSFDPPEVLPFDKGKRYRKVTYPRGMENWITSMFDGATAGWKTGLQPFGQFDGNQAPLTESCTSPFCRCGEKTQDTVGKGSPDDSRQNRDPGT